MLRDLVTEWHLVESDEDHHGLSADALGKTQHATDYHDQFLKRAKKASPLALHHDAMTAAQMHGEAEVAHLKAAKHQHMAGNHELANHHFSHAHEHGGKREGLVHGAMDAHDFHLDDLYKDQPHMRVTILLAKPDGTKDGEEDEKEYDELSDKAHIASMDAAIRPPHEMGHGSYHHRAAEAHKKAGSAAGKIANKRQHGDHEHFAMNKRVHEFHTKLHRDKSNI